jgi:hypothetical protein
MAPRDFPGRHHVLDRRLSKFVPTYSYRQALATALKTGWLEAKQVIRNTEISAAVSARISPEAKARIRELLDQQNGLPITQTGNAEYRAVTAEIPALTWGSR